MILIENTYTYTVDHGDYTVVIEYLFRHECRVHWVSHSLVKGTIQLTIDEETFEVDALQSSPCHVPTRCSLRPSSHYQTRIPKRILQTHETIPSSLLLRNTQRALQLLNPEYTYHFFDAQQRRHFIQRHFEPKVLFAYDTLVPGAFQADLFRYCALYILGGCYVDVKMIPRRSFRHLICSNDEFLLACDYERTNSMEWTVGTSFLNALLCSVPQHSFLLRLIRRVTQNVLHHQQAFLQASRHGTQCILDVTGPTMVYKELSDLVSESQLRWKHIIVNHDETTYTNFQLVDRHTRECIFTKTCLGTSPTEHYSQLWNRQELFFQHQTIREGMDVFVYPHPFPDTFHFDLTNDQLTITRGQDEGWWLKLRIKLIVNGVIRWIDIGRSSGPTKVIDLKSIEE